MRSKVTKTVEASATEEEVTLTILPIIPVEVPDEVEVPEFVVSEILNPLPEETLVVPTALATRIPRFFE